MSSNISSIRDRMSSLKLSIEQCDKEIEVLQQEVNSHTARAEQAEEETKLANIKYRDEEDKKSDLEDGYRELKAQMAELETDSEENGRFARVLRVREKNNTDRIEELEALLIQQNKDIERLGQLNSDLQSKSQQLEDRLEDAEEKGIQLKSVYDENMEEITQLRNRYKSLLASDKKMTETCEKYETDCNMKEDLYKKMSDRADAAETTCETLKRHITDLEDELEQWKEKIKSCELECSQTYAELQDL